MTGCGPGSGLCIVMGQLPRVALQAALAASWHGESLAAIAACGARGKALAARPAASKHRHFADHPIAGQPRRLHSAGFGDDASLHGGVEFAQVDETAAI